MGLALTCPDCLKVTVSALPAAERGLGREGTRELGSGGFGVPGCHVVSVTFPETGIHGVKAQCAIPAPLFSLHPSAPAAFIAFFCLFITAVNWLPTC